MDGSYRICWTIDDWVRALREANESMYVGLDFESKPNPRFIDFAPKKIDGVVNNAIPSALRPEFGAKACGTAISWYDESTKSIKSAYVGGRHWQRYAGGEQPDPSAVAAALDDFMRERPADRIIVVHNLSMELSILLTEGVAWPKRGQLHDLQVAARVLNKGVGWKELIGLKPLQKEVLGKDLDTKNDLDRWLKSHGFKPGADIWRAPVALAGMYAQDDARDTLDIFMRWMDAIYQPPTSWWWDRAPDRRQRKDLYELEIEAAINATISALRGQRFDRPLASRQTSAANTLQNVAKRWIRHYLDMPTLNPGSQTQLRGILFRNTKYGFRPSLAHTTKAFKDLSERDQVKVMAGHMGNIIDYMSLDVDALAYYAEKYPEHADLMFMLAVYRKCNTALSWFDERVLQFAVFACPDPWFSSEMRDWIDLIFHRLRTVGTVSGRMSSADFNAQQVPKRFKMLMDASRLFNLLEAFLPANQLRQLMEMLLVSECKKGDEAKVLGLEPGAPVIDFSVRALFIPRPGFNIRGLDLSQVELRGFAHYTGNRLLCEGYGRAMTDAEVGSELRFMREMIESGSVPDMDAFPDLNWERHVEAEANSFDAHQFVADEIGLDRKGAKGINFGIIYGMGRKKLARGLGWSIDEGRTYLRAYNERLPEIELIQTQIKAALRGRGYVFDPFGRRYYLPINRAYVGLNRLIQGWAASAFKVGFVRTSELFSSDIMGASEVHPLIGRRIPEGAKVLTCIHDELLNEIHKDLDTPLTDWAIRSSMTAFYGLKTSLSTSSERGVGSWDSSEDVKAVSLRRVA